MFSLLLTAQWFSWLPCVVQSCPGNEEDYSRCATPTKLAATSSLMAAAAPPLLLLSAVLAAFSPSWALLRIRPNVTISRLLFMEVRCSIGELIFLCQLSKWVETEMALRESLMEMAHAQLSCSPLWFSLTAFFQVVGKFVLRGNCCELNTCTVYIAHSAV